MPIRRPRRAARRRVGAVGTVAVALGLLLTGCVGAPAPTPTPTEESTAAPIFASDEEALAAAEAAYERFLIASAVVSASGGKDLTPLEGVATGAAHESQQESAAAYVKDNLHSTGRREFTTYKLQSYESEHASGAVITFYVCDDLRGLDVVDANGSSVVAADRIVDVPYRVVVEGTPDALTVSEKDLWDRDNFCG